MIWVGLAGFIAAARTPLQVAVLAYVGAGGLVGVAVVGVVMFTPAGLAVQEAIEPARELVQAILPVSVPSMWTFDPRQEVAGRSATPFAVATSVTVVADAAPVPAEKATPRPTAEESALLESSVPALPDGSIRPVLTAPFAVSVAPTAEVDQALPGLAADADLPVAVGSAAFSPSPAGTLAAAPRLAVDRPTADPPTPTAEPQTPIALATAVVRRFEVPSAASSVVQAVATALPTAIATRAPASHTHTDAPRPTPEPTRAPATVALEPVVEAIEPIHVPPTPAPVVATSVPAVFTRVPVPTPGSTVSPTHAPTLVPTHVPAPTASPNADPSKTPVPPTPTPKPTQTRVPTKVPTQAPVPTATPKPTVKPTAKPTVKPTTVPTHAPATATPIRERPVPGNPTPEVHHG